MPVLKRSEGSDDAVPFGAIVIISLVGSFVVAGLIGLAVTIVTRRLAANRAREESERDIEAGRAPAFVNDVHRRPAPKPKVALAPAAVLPVTRAKHSVAAHIRDAPVPPRHERRARRDDPASIAAYWEASPAPVAPARATRTQKESRSRREDRSVGKRRVKDKRHHGRHKSSHASHTRRHRHSNNELQDVRHDESMSRRVLLCGDMR